MKTLIATSVLAALLASGVAVMAQEQTEDYLGLPGDNLNLYAVMKLFQESKTLDEFERDLNDENSMINNLDLNGDNLIDYINVLDNVNGNVHNIVLQVAVNERERQDVAVFTVERDRKGNVVIQLTGDEALYGENYIIEPVFDDTINGQTPNPGFAGNALTINGRRVNVVTTTTVEIAYWPVITYIYDPGYIVWRSSWYWGYYPEYWHPWRPFYWHYYSGYHYQWYDHYYAHYRRWHHHRHDFWDNYYYRPHHTHSTYVTVNIRNGHYKSTYSRPEERKNGEALYSSTHRNNNNSRTESTRIENHNRRTSNSSATERSSGSSQVSSSRRQQTGASGKAEVRPETRTNSGRTGSVQVRRDTEVSTRKSEGTVTRTKTAEGRTSVQSRPSETRSRESSKSAAPSRSESKAQASKSRSDKQQSKSKNSKTKKESKRR